MHLYIAHFYEKQSPFGMTFGALFAVIIIVKLLWDIRGDRNSSSPRRRHGKDFKTFSQFTSEDWKKYWEEERKRRSESRPQTPAKNTRYR